MTTEDRQSELVHVSIFATWAEAEVAKGLLEANGIAAALVPQDELLFGTGSGGRRKVRILVREEDVEDARNLIGGDVQNPRSLAEIFKFTQQELNAGQSTDGIVEELVAQGWPEDWARRHVADRARQRSAGRRGEPTDPRVYVRRMGRGFASILVGVLLTVATFEMAQAAGIGMYIVWWGAILWGLVDFIAGLVGWLRHR